jgi:hypothetical protein
MVFGKGQASSRRQRMDFGQILRVFGTGLFFRRNRCNEKEEITDARRLQETSFQGDGQPMDIREGRTPQSLSRPD